MRTPQSSRRQGNLTRKLRWIALAAAGVQAIQGLPPRSGRAVAAEIPSRASRGAELPREPKPLSERQVNRGVGERLQHMQQRHESSRATRQAALHSADRSRAIAASEPALRREPIKLSVQPLP